MDIVIVKLCWTGSSDNPLNTGVLSKLPNLTSKYNPCIIHQKGWVIHRKVIHRLNTLLSVDLFDILILEHYEAGQVGIILGGILSTWLTSWQHCLLPHYGTLRTSTQEINLILFSFMEGFRGPVSDAFSVRAANMTQNSLSPSILITRTRARPVSRVIVRICTIVYTKNNCTRIIGKDRSISWRDINDLGLWVGHQGMWNMEPI